MRIIKKVNRIWKKIHTLGHPYKKSHHVQDYKEIAEAFNVSPDYIYMIAHGGRVRRQDDILIRKELRARGIIR